MTSSGLVSTIVATFALMTYQQDTVINRRVRYVPKYFGKVPSVEYYGFIVALVYHYNENSLIRQCTGSAIKINMILTSSHCLQGNIGFVQYTDFHKKPKDDQTMKRALEIILPPHQRKKGQPKYAVALAETVGLLRIENFTMEDEINYAVLSKSRNLHHGLHVMYAGLQRVKNTNSGMHFPNGMVFTGEAEVIDCPIVLKYVCLKVHEEYDVPSGSGGPVLIGDHIVGVVNQKLDIHSVKNGKNTFTMIPVHSYIKFITSIDL